MSLKERIMKPLLDAQFEKGVATTTAKYEAWKTRQEAVGVVFVPDPEDGEEPSAQNSGTKA